MGIFKKRDRPQICPLCAEVFGRTQGLGHWTGHLVEGSTGAGRQPGYTWVCSCGPSDMAWTNDFAAASAMAIHMYRAHQIALSAPLDDFTFLTTIERQLGLH